MIFEDPAAQEDENTIKNVIAVEENVMDQD